MSYDMICRCTPSSGLSSTLTGLRTSINSLTGRVTAAEERLDAFAVSEFGRVVTTEEELLAAAAIGMPAFVSGDIELTGSLVDGLPVGFHANTDRIKVTGISNGVTNGRLSFPHVTGAPRSVVQISARHVELHNLELTTNHPLTTDIGDYDAGIRLSADSVRDISDFVIDEVDIYNVWAGIMRSGTSISKVYERSRIVNSRVHAFCEIGMYIEYNAKGIRIDNNEVRGRDVGQSHAVGSSGGAGQGIRVGSCDYAIVSRNRISEIGSIGIELYSAPLSLGGVANSNLLCQIINNQVSDTDGFGISVLGSDSTLVQGNQVLRATGIGIETYNNTATLGKLMILGNRISDVRPVATADVCCGMTVDQVTNALIQGNTIKNVTSPGVLESAGIQIVNNGENISILGNDLTDAGSHMIWINGNGVDVYNRISIEGNILHVSPDYDSAYNHLSYWPAIRVSRATASVRHNVVHYPAATPGYGGMNLTDGGTVYSGGAADAPLVWAGAGLNIEQSNVRIPY